MTDAPEHGARFEILRTSAGGDHAVFGITVLAAGATFVATTKISGAAVETTWAPEPPPWIADTTHGFAKMLQKNHAADGSWPSRLVRWRSER
jgi:hypothetical protein